MSSSYMPPFCSIKVMGVDKIEPRIDADLAAAIRDFLLRVGPPVTKGHDGHPVRVPAGDLAESELDGGSPSLFLLEVGASGVLSLAGMTSSPSTVFFSGSPVKKIAMKTRMLSKGEIKAALVNSLPSPELDTSSCVLRQK
jgi:hypothetical protein